MRNRMLLASIAVLTALSGYSYAEEESAAEEPILERKLTNIERRLAFERATQDNPFVITPHRMNYILPYTVADDINRGVYEFGRPEWVDNLEDDEAKFQLSFKIPLNYGDLMFEGDALYFGFTVKSWWQIYSSNISAPFRETNYRPELFYVAPSDWKVFNGSTAWGFGIEHESNGRSIPLSRSWNRAYLLGIYEHEDFSLGIQPWIRLSTEDSDEEDPTASDFDDNPDIEDYMGYFELQGAYRYEKITLNSTGRLNFDTGKGFIELGMTFPIWGRVRGYVQYSNGYGESLIDYDYSQSRFGIGLALTDPI